MSKDTLEVGDLWYVDYHKIIVYKIEDRTDFFDGLVKDALYCLENWGLRISAHWYHPERLKKKGKYLGKSKANIDDLFKTENE